MTEPVVVRIAPSPTGDPHVGTAYVCLFNMAFRRKHGGRFILRIDDTDRERYRADSEAAITRELRWLGMSWDEGPDVGGPKAPYRQSERTELYREACAELVAKGAAYRCDCTEERLNQVREAQKARKEQPRYDGHCRSRAVDASARHVVRLKVPAAGETSFVDGLRGVITIENRTVDDQVLLKSDGFPTYHLATVVDDHRMGVTHILRAEEWINSTPKHVLLYHALGWPLPKFFHLPLLRNADKSKISKRKNPTSITWYREQGFLPEAMLNFLGLMGFSLGDDREVFSVEEFTAAFEPEAIKTTGPVFDLQKLEWLNGVYIRKLAPGDLADRLAAVSAAARGADRALLLRVVPLVQERMKRLSEFDSLAGFFFEKGMTPPHDELIPKGKDDTNVAAVLRILRQAIVAMPDLPDPKALEERFRGVAQEVDWKPKDLFMALRVAITGRTVTPPLMESMCILGRPECIARLDAAIDVLGNPENPILGAGDRKA